jgi:shikimate kinase/3-dehydroquinate synthase
MKFDLDFKDKKIIVLIGLMGVGKTTVGKKLANKAGFYFIDSDQEIEDRQQKSIVDIFKSKGEKYFRQIEKEIIKEIICRDEKIVLSLGGGAFMDKEIRALIKKLAISVWLYADIEILLHRISNKSNRPLLNNVDRRSLLLELITKRYPIYRQADIHIENEAINNNTLFIKKLMNKINDFVCHAELEREFVRVDLSNRSYDIVVGSNVVDNIGHYITKIGNYSNIIVITDNNIAKLYPKILQDYLKPLSIPIKNIIVEAGEGAKSFANLQNVMEQILEYGVDRNSLIIAFGGGVIGDLSGFIASILLRGIDFIQVPTTLLAMVDSSVGGKTAINSKFGKNLVGSFYQPKVVLCDLNFLQTLSKRDFISGYAEIVKYGLIKDNKFFLYLEQNLDKILNRDIKILQNIIVKSCKIKAEIVGLDEREGGVRAILNFGHTFGHTFETEAGYSDLLLHGEAVAIGMVMAIKMSIELKMLEGSNLFVVLNHLKKSGLPISPNSIKKSWDIMRLTSHLYRDKKVENGNLTFILLENIGKAVIKKNAREQDFIKIIESC